MRDSKLIFDEVKTQLISIKHHGGAMDQYDSALFTLFIEAYKNGYMDFNSQPRLTAQAIVDTLMGNEEYNSNPSKTNYKVEEYFYTKWSIWTEAFTKGFESNYIMWKT